MIIKQCKLGVGYLRCIKEAHLFCWSKNCVRWTLNHSIVKKKQKAAVEELFDILSLRSNLPTSQKEYFILLRQNYIQDHLSSEIIYIEKPIYCLNISSEEFYPLGVLLKLL